MTLQLIAALQDCVMVMERELSGLAVIQPELKQARAALDVAFAPADPWTGEGLPPVGTVCEWKEKTGFQWVAATVLFITESSVVCQRADGFEWQMLTKRTVFRPIGEPEQVEDDERAAGIEALSKVLQGHMGECLTIRQSAEALYDANYRKQVMP